MPILIHKQIEDGVSLMLTGKSFKLPYAQRTLAFSIQREGFLWNVKRFSHSLKKTVFTPKYKQVLIFYTNGKQE